MTVPTPGSAEAVTYAQETDGSHQSRVVLSLGFPMWTAEKSDVFGGSDLTAADWWSTLPEPDVSGGTVSIGVEGLPPFQIVGSNPLWLPTVEEIGFQVIIDAAFPDATPGYHQFFGLMALDGGRGKDSAPMIVIQSGEDHAAPAASVGDLHVRSASVNAAQQITSNPQGSHRYKFIWDPTGGSDGGPQITIEVDGTQVYQYDNTDVTDPLEPGNSRVANPNCVKPYMITFGYIAEHNADVGTPSGAKGSATTGIRVEDVTVTADDTVDAVGTLTLAGQPANNETVVIDGKTYTFQTTLTDSDGNVLISAVDASGSIDNLIAAITLGDGAGTDYATAMTLHGSCTAAVGGGDTMICTARVPGTAGNSLTTTETLATGGSEWGGATLASGADGTNYETQVWPAWTTANAGGDIDDAVLGERFVLDSETWAKLPGIVGWIVNRGRDLTSDTFRLTLSAADPGDADVHNQFQGSFTQGIQQDRFLGRPLLIDTRILREDSTATAWKRQIAGVIESSEMGKNDRGEVTIDLGGRDRPSVKLDSEISRSYVAVAGDANPDVLIDGFDMDEILEDIVDLSDTIYDGDVLGATDTDIQLTPDMSPAALVAGPNLLQALTQIVDEIGMELWRSYTVSGAGRYGQINIARWTLGPEHGIASDVYGPFTRFIAAGEGSPHLNNIRRPALTETLLTGAGHVSVHADNMLSGAFSLSLMGGEPGPGDFPMFPYPPRSRELRMSLAEGSIGFTIPTWTMFDQFGNDHGGGPGLSRWRRENTNRRQVALEMIGQDWAQPTDPIEVDDPLDTGLVPASMQNLHANPSIETDTTGYSVASADTNTIAKSSAQARVGTSSLLLTRNSVGTVVQVDFAITFPSKDQFVWSFWIYIPTDWDQGAITARFENFSFSTFNHASNVDMSIVDRWQRVFLTQTLASGGLTGTLRIQSAGGGTAGRFFYIDANQAEFGEYPTAYADGERPGVAWDGTQHLSASTRIGELFVVNAIRISERDGVLRSQLGLVTAEVELAIRRSL